MVGKACGDWPPRGPVAPVWGRRRRRAALIWDACEWDGGVLCVMRGTLAASRGMMLYSKIHEDITPTSQAERQREGKFQYRRVRVFGGGIYSGRVCQGSLHFSSLPLPVRTKGERREWIEWILQLWKKKNRLKILDRLCVACGEFDFISFFHFFFLT